MPALSSILAVASIGATIGSAYISSSASGNAAESQAEAAQAAQAWQEKVYYQNRKDMAPWMVAGKEALGTLVAKVGAGPGEYKESPYYNFLLEQGTRGLERGAAAKGLQLSGAEQKALTKYGQNLASTDYQNWLNQWYQSLTPYQSLAGLGQTATQQTATLGTQQAGQIGQNILAGGQAQAAGQLGQANTYANLLGWGGQQLGNYATYNALNQQQYQQPYNYQYADPYSPYYMGF